MEAVGGNSRLGAEAEFESVREASGRVDVDASRIDLAFKARRGIVVLRYDRVSEARAMAADKLDRLVEGADQLHRKNQLEVLGIPILVGGVPDIRDHRASRIVAAKL